jgi:WbqC-like protein family
MPAPVKNKKVAILQSNYIPWKGYFDIIASVDEFYLFDDVQFTRRDWRNRNKIILGGKVHWLTIPVVTKGAFDAPIGMIAIADRSWARKHWTSIRHAYAKAPHFRDVAPLIEPIYTEAAALTKLSDVNELFLRKLSAVLGLTTTFLRSADVPRVAGNPTGRLVELCAARHAALYLSGPAAKSYIQKAQFDAAGIALAYADYAGYPLYDQGAETFEHGVSIIDVLMRCGLDATPHLKSRQTPPKFMVTA